MRRIGGRTEFDKHLAEFDQYNTVGEQHTDNTGSEQPKHAVHDGAAQQQPVHDRAKQFNHT